MNLHIATPEKIVFSGSATSVTAVGEKGELQILPRHAGLVTFLYEGTVKVASDAGDKRFHVGSGILRVDEDQVVLLTKKVAEI